MAAQSEQLPVFAGIEALGLLPVESSLESHLDEKKEEYSEVAFTYNEMDDTEDESPGATCLIADPYDERRVIHKIPDRKDVYLSIYPHVISVPTRTEKLNVYRLLKGVRELSTHKSWLVLLLSGGRFTGALFKVGPKFSDFKCTHHKSLARYTTRRKQGGSQSARDQAGGGHVSSAGANIRRHNEKKLQEEILAVLQQWEPAINECNRIFMYAPARNHMLVHQKGSPIPKSDPRIRPVPMSIYRPTTGEAKRVFRQLATASFVEIAGDPSKVKKKKKGKLLAKEKDLSDITEENEQKKKVEAKIEKKVDPEEKENIVTAEEKAILDYVDEKKITDEKEWMEKFVGLCDSAGLNEEADWEVGVMARVIDKLIQNGKREAVLYLLRLPDAETEIDYQLEHWHFRTSLHRASKKGDPVIVTALLDLKADPTIQGIHNQRPFNLGSSTTAKEAFLEFARENKELWPWSTAGVSVAPKPRSRGSSRSRSRSGSRGRKKEKKAEEPEKEDVGTKSAPETEIKHEKEEKSESETALHENEETVENSETQSKEPSENKIGSKSHSKKAKRRARRKNKSKYKAQKQTETLLQELLAPECVEWACDACTYVNAKDATICHMCNAPKPKPKGGDLKWKCGRCTYVNVVTGTGATCAMCGAPRPEPKLASKKSKGAKRRQRRRKNKQNAAAENKESDKIKEIEETKKETKEGKLEKKEKKEDRNQKIKENKGDSSGRKLGGSRVNRSRLLDSVPRASAINRLEEAKKKVKELYAKYFKQLTDGCGVTCENDYCRSSAQNKNVPSLTPAQAATTALDLIKRFKSEKLCPAFR